MVIKMVLHKHGWKWQKLNKQVQTLLITTAGHVGAEDTKQLGKISQDTHFLYFTHQINFNQIHHWIDFLEELRAQDAVDEIPLPPSWRRSGPPCTCPRCPWPPPPPARRPPQRSTGRSTQPPQSPPSSPSLPTDRGWLWESPQAEPCHFSTCPGPANQDPGEEEDLNVSFFLSLVQKSIVW